MSFMKMLQRKITLRRCLTLVIFFIRKEKLVKTVNYSSKQLLGSENLFLKIFLLGIPIFILEQCIKMEKGSINAINLPLNFIKSLLIRAMTLHEKDLEIYVIQDMDASGQTKLNPFNGILLEPIKETPSV